MRKSVSLTVALLLGVAASANAQSSASSSATVTAAVSLAPLTLATTGDTNFGTVSAGDITNQTGNSLLSPTAPGTGQSAAMFTASGEKNIAVLVTCAPASALTHSLDATKTINFTGHLANSSASTGQSTAGVMCAGGGSFSVMLNETGNHYFWLGGQLTNVNSSPSMAGTYTGSYTLSVNY